MSSFDRDRQCLFFSRSSLGEKCCQSLRPLIALNVFHSIKFIWLYWLSSDYKTGIQLTASTVKCLE